MRRLDWRRATAWLPSQTPDLSEVAGLARERLDVAAWAILPDGDLRPGAGAIFSALDQLLPGGMPVSYTAYRLPGMRHVADGAYRWVARNRARFPGTPTCAMDRPPAPLTEGARDEIARRKADRV